MSVWCQYTVVGRCRIPSCNNWGRQMYKLNVINVGAEAGKLG